MRRSIPVFTDENQRTKVWEQVVVQSKRRSEMGAYLIISPDINRQDKIALNLHLKAMADLTKEYYRDGGWYGACMDMGLMQMMIRMDSVNRIASRYPVEVRQYNTIREKAGGSLSDPKTKFVRTWEGHFKKPLLNEYIRQFPQKSLCGF